MPKQKLQHLAAKVRQICDQVQSYNGQRIAPNQMGSDVQTDFLHTNGNILTEEESAKIERENKQAFDLIQGIKKRIKDIAKSD